MPVVKELEELFDKHNIKYVTIVCHEHAVSDDNVELYKR